MQYSVLWHTISLNDIKLVLIQNVSRSTYNLFTSPNLGSSTPRHPSSPPPPPLPFVSLPTPQVKYKLHKLTYIRRYHYLIKYTYLCPQICIITIILTWRPRYGSTDHILMGFSHIFIFTFSCQVLAARQVESKSISPTLG